MSPESAIAWFTLILAVATVWLAFATHRLGRATAQSVDLETRPYLAFQDFHFNFYVHNSPKDPRNGQTDLRVALRFRNPSKVLVTYAVQKIHVTFDGRTADDPKFNSRGGTVYPSDQTSFWFDVINSVDTSSFPRKGIAEFEIKYFSAKGGKEYVTRRKIEYYVNALNPFSMDWMYLEQSDE